VSFRQLGVPVPRGTTTETLDRLGALIDVHRATRVIFLATCCTRHEPTRRRRWRRSGAGANAMPAST